MRSDAADIERRERLARGGDRSVHVDAAAGILDHDRGEALPVRVLGRVANAEIERQAGEKHARQPALAQIAGEAGRRRLVVLEKRRIGIDGAAESLALRSRR